MGNDHDGHRPIGPARGGRNVGRDRPRLPQGRTARAAPAPPVTVARPIVRTVTTYAYFTGHLEAKEYTEIRPRVKGFLQSVNYIAGADVKKDDLLFIIDPSPYKAALDQAEADLARNQASRTQAELHLKRIQDAFSKNVATEMEVIDAQARYDEATAGVAAGQAAVEQAKLNYGWTHIRAPYDGRVSRNFVDIGNLVGTSEPTLLANIVQIDPIYAYFDVSERELLWYRRQARARGAEHTDSDTAPASLGLVTDKGYPYDGYLDYAANKLDESTGTIEVRGVFPNPDLVLLPGLFARIRLPIGEQRNALLVATRALGTSQAGPYLLVVNDKNVVQLRLVEPGPVVGGLQVIRSGLKADEWVIVNGLQRARPGFPVTVQQGPMPDAASLPPADIPTTQPTAPAPAARQPAQPATRPNG